jgi:superfamily II DNA or RNA helicase
MMPDLRAYQLDVVDRAAARVRAGVRHLIIQGATGSGKTHVSSEITRRAVDRGKKVLFLAHRRRLIRQKSERLDQFRVPHGIIMNGVSGYSGAPVQVASKDTLLSRSVRNQWVTPPPADLVIIDEAHLSLSEQYQTLVSLYPRAVILGLTATPALGDGRGLAPYYQDIVSTVPTSQLIREGFLVPVQCYAPEESRQRALQGQRKLLGDPVYNWKKYASGRPTVLFATRVDSSLAVVKAFLDAGIPAEHLDSNSTDDEREAVLERVQSGQTLVLSNVGIMTEGIDVPCLSCCILLRLVGSYVFYAQAVGRVMRPHPGKTEAVLIDHAGAVRRHGLPTQDVEWSIDPEDTVESRNRKARKEGKRATPITCPACAYQFVGSIICPACGHKLPRRLQPTRTEDALLVPVGDDATPSPAALREEQVRYWHTCLRVMANKGRTCAAASCMFRSKYRSWPPADFPNVPEPGQRQEPVALVFPQYLTRRTG